MNTQYCEGIHQFLQLKENVTLTIPNLITNFSSNVGFFRRYKENLTGLSGTLGSDSVRHFLTDIYNVDFVYIPPFRRRMLEELPSKIEFSREKWKNSILQEAIKESQTNNRCCLIICKTALDVGDLTGFMISGGKFNPHKILTYSDSEDLEQEKRL